MSPPEAYFALDGATSCPVTAVVGPDGRPVGARAEGCPAVLASSIETRAMGVRWAAAGETTTERVAIEVRPPSFTPTKVDGACFVAFRVVEGRPTQLGRVPVRCDLAYGPVATVHSRERMQRTAWCTVDVARVDGGPPDVQVGACADGMATHAREAVASWTFPQGRARSWRVLIGYELGGPTDADLSDRPI